MVVIAWLVHFRPDLGPNHPIFEPAGPGLPPIAFAGSPVAPTWARFSEGLSRHGEPNQLRILPAGTGWLSARLDYNPLKEEQVPLVNGSFTTQEFVPRVRKLSSRIVALIHPSLRYWNPSVVRCCENSTPRQVFSFEIRKVVLS